MRGGGKNRYYYADKAGLLFVAALGDRSFVVVERCDWSRMNMLYNKMVSRFSSGNRGEAWMRIELVKLRSESWRWKSFLKKKAAPHCSPGLLTMKIHFLNHVVNNLERLESLVVMNAGPSEQFNVLMRTSYGVTSRWLFKRLHETAKTTSSALTTVERPESEVHESAAPICFFSKRKCVEDSMGYLASYEV